MIEFTNAGGLLVVTMQQGFSTRTLGFSQGLSGGFMLAVTLLEILPEALRQLSITAAVGWVCAGAAVIYLLKVSQQCVGLLWWFESRGTWRPFKAHTTRNSPTPRCRP